MRQTQTRKVSSMTTVDLIITVASWEPRFILGMERTLGSYSSPRLLVYFIREYEERTRDARIQLRSIADRQGIRFEEQEVSFCLPGSTWRVLEDHLGPKSDAGDRVLVDLTTMPREMIWSALFWLQASCADVHYVYNRPRSYGAGWLARDPEDPRLMFKLSGDLKLGRPTALLAATGYDVDRCLQAIEFYEPAQVLLATQRGDQYDNLRRNVAATVRNFPHEHIEIDAYSSDHGYGVLRQGVEKLALEHNVILCSFGPKLSGIALFKLQREYAETALAYIGCKEYNIHYSSGLGDPVEGVLPWHKSQE